MELLITLIFGIAIGSLFAWSVIKNPECKKARGAVKKKANLKEKRIKRLTEFLMDKNKINNDQVERFLRVSNATAERYLNELEREGKLEQVGKKGRGVYYKVKL